MADAQYAIEIAASMPGGDQTIAELDELTRELMGAGKDADFFSEAIKATSMQLDEAKASAALATGALSDAKRELAGLEAAALKAADAAEKHAHGQDATLARVDKAKAAIEGHTIALEKARAASIAASAAAEAYAQSANVDASALARLRIAEIQAAAAVDSKTYALATANRQLIATEKAAEKFTARQAYLAKEAEAARAAVTAQAGEFARIEKAAEDATAAEAKLASTQKNLAKLQSHTNKSLSGQAEKLEKVAAAATQFGGPLGGMIARVVNAKKSHAALGATIGSGRATMLAATAAAVGLTAAVVAIGIAGAVGVVGLAAAVIKLADTTGELDKIGARFKKNMSKMFKGVDISPVTRGLGRLASMFDATTGTGKTFKAMTLGLVDPLIKGFEIAAYYLEAFIIGFQIGLLKLYIAAKPAIKWVRELFGGSDMADPAILDSIAEIGELAAKAFGVMAVAIGAVTLAIGALVAAFVAAPIALVAFVDFVIGQFMALPRVVADVIDLIVKPWAEAGANMLRGFIGGFLQWKSALIATIKNTFGDAITAAKSVLGIRSPSVVMAGIADDTAAGYTQQIDRRAPEAQEATARMVEPPEPTMRLGAPSGQAGPSINLSGATFVFQGVPGSEDAERRFTELLTRILEGDASALSGELAA